MERTHTPFCFQVGLSIWKLAHGAQLPPKPSLAPRDKWYMSTRNDYGRAVRWMWRLRHALNETNNASMKRTHTPVCFQVGLSSMKTSSRSSVTTKPELAHRTEWTKSTRND